MSGEPIAEWVEQMVTEESRVREQHPRLLIRPRPRWLPERVWGWLIGRLIYLEESS